ncbi:MAG: diaminopimelate epimerase [Waddliaceae bacterium]
MNFHKYVGCGNDFILFDARRDVPDLDIPRLCHRQNGIGADGVILLQKSDPCDYRMSIFNADGSEAEMCGNGIRCLGLFLRHLQERREEVTIETLAGPYKIVIGEDAVSVNMGAPTQVEFDIELEKFTVDYLDTGVPHAVVVVDDARLFPLENEGKWIRHHTRFSPRGVNVTVASPGQSGFYFRTYERGVEAETLACGTGACAAAFVLKQRLNINGPMMMISMAGESIEISFSGDQLMMKGPAKHVFSGQFKEIEKVDAFSVFR